MQDQIGHAAMGLYAALLSLAFTLRPFADAGMSQYTIKRIANDSGNYSTLMGPTVLLKLGFSVLYIAGLVGLGWLWGYRGFALYLLAVLGLVHAALNLLEVFRAAFQGFQHFRLDGLATIWDKTVLMLLIVAMLAWNMLTLENFVWATLLSMGSATVIFGGVALWKYGRVKVRASRRKATFILRRSFPFALVVVLFSFNERLNQLLLESWASDDEAGYYYAAFRWVGTIQMYLWTVLPVFYAKFAKNFRKPPEVQQALFNAGQAIVALPILAVAGFLWFQGERLFFMFQNSTPQELAYMSLNLKILGGMLAINGVFNIYSTYLTATGREKYVNKLLIASITLSTGANYFFIPLFGAQAASWVLLGAFAFLSTGYVMVVTERTPLRPPVGLLMKIMLVAGLYLAVYYSLLQLSVPWWVPCPVALAVMAAATFGLKLINFKSVIE